MGLISLTFLNSLDLRRDTPYTCISPASLRANHSYPVTGLETEIETRLRRREDKMAHVEIDVGSLPQPQRMAAGKPTVTIGGNGQVRMSSKACYWVAVVSSQGGRANTSIRCISPKVKRIEKCEAD